MTITTQQIAPVKSYQMRHAYLVRILSGGQPFGAEVWFGDGTRRRADLLWFSTNESKAQELVDQINTGRE